MNKQKSQSYYDFKEYLKARYDYISKMQAMLLSRKIGFSVTGLEIIEICNDLYG